MYTYILSLDMCVMYTFISVFIAILRLITTMSLALFPLKVVILFPYIVMVWKNIYVSKCVSGRHLGSWLYSISDLGCVHFIFH